MISVVSVAVYCHVGGSWRPTSLDTLVAHRDQIGANRIKADLIDPDWLGGELGCSASLALSLSSWTMTPSGVVLDHTG